ncbi:MAG: DUF924 family protein [bacterium]
MQKLPPDIKVLLDFWFSEEARPYWFRSSAEFDRRVTRDYRELWERARNWELDSWGDTAEGSLALVLLLDQIPLHMFRGQPQAYSTEVAARFVAVRAVERGQDQGLNSSQKQFLYMPFMHSELLEDQLRAVELLQNAGIDSRWAKHHCGIIQQFGRFPHRNQLLGRESTVPEQAWLDSKEAFNPG